MTTKGFQVNVDMSRVPFTVVAAAGELDGAAAPILRAQLGEVIASGATEVTLDLSEVTFLDSTGLGVLVCYHRLLHAEGGHLRLIVTQPNIQRVFEITGVNRVLFVYDTQGDALLA